MVTMETESSTRAKTLGETSPNMFSYTYARKRKRGESSAEADQTASKKLEFDVISGSSTSQTSVTENNSPKSTQLEQRQEQQVEEVSVLDLFKQQQALLKIGFEPDSCVNDLEDFGQVFDDCTDFDDIFVGEIEEHYGINGFPWKAFVSLPEGVC